MNKYEQKIRFELRFSITAKSAEEANAMLQQKLGQIEFDSDLQPDGYDDFEDDPIECPVCNGEGTIEDGVCSRCNGDCEVPFEPEK